MAKIGILNPVKNIRCVDRIVLDPRVSCYIHSRSVLVLSHIVYIYQTGNHEIFAIFLFAEEGNSSCRNF